MLDPVMDPYSVNFMLCVCGLIGMLICHHYFFEFCALYVISSLFVGGRQMASEYLSSCLFHHILCALRTALCCNPMNVNLDISLYSAAIILLFASISRFN